MKPPRTGWTGGGLTRPRPAVWLGRDLSRPEHFVIFDEDDEDGGDDDDDDVVYLFEHTTKIALSSTALMGRHHRASDIIDARVKAAIQEALQRQSDTTDNVKEKIQDIDNATAKIHQAKANALSTALTGKSHRASGTIDARVRANIQRVSGTIDNANAEIPDIDAKAKILAKENALGSALTGMNHHAPNLIDARVQARIQEELQRLSDTFDNVNEKIQDIHVTAKIQTKAYALGTALTGMNHPAPDIDARVKAAIQDAIQRQSTTIDDANATIPGIRKANIQMQTYALGAAPTGMNHHAPDFIDARLTAKIQDGDQRASNAIDNVEAMIQAIAEKALKDNARGIRRLGMNHLASDTTDAPVKAKIQDGPSGCRAPAAPRLRRSRTLLDADLSEDRPPEASGCARGWRSRDGHGRALTLMGEPAPRL